MSAIQGPVEPQDGSGVRHGAEQGSASQVSQALVHDLRRLARIYSGDFDREPAPSGEIISKLATMAADRITELERPVGTTKTFWVIEWQSEPVGGPPRYWGGWDQGWLFLIDEAIKFFDRRSVERALARSRLQGEPREHAYIANSGGE